MQSALVLALVLSVPGVAAQKGDEPRAGLPKKGDAVVVKGCLRGPRLEATQISPAEADDAYPSGWTFRLQGKKDLLKDLRAKHDNMLVDVSGVLKSELPETVPGKQVGRTRITIGVDPYGGGRTPGSDQVMPVLDVRSFESSGVTCK